MRNYIIFFVLIAFSVMNAQRNDFEYPLTLQENASPTKIWGTYIGGYNNEAAYSIAKDNKNNVIIAGYVGLVKFNSYGKLQWSTSYGDKICSVATDNFGNIYIAGIANKLKSIATKGAHQETFGGGLNDAFLAKFDSNGVLLWGTYYGGEDNEEFWASVSTDIFNNVYLVGQTKSMNNIATSGAHQSSINGNSTTSYFSKFNSNGVRLWGTYYGGIYWGAAISLTTDNFGNIYLCGITSNCNKNEISTTGSHQVTCGGGEDAYLVKFDSNGVRQWGTYYGGKGREIGNSIKLDNLGNIYLAGTTHSNDGISTDGSYQSSHAGGLTDAFLVKFDSNGVRQWGTYYGGKGGSYESGSGGDFGHAIFIDDYNNIYMTGITSSDKDIATQGSYQSNYCGIGDAYIVKFDNNGVRQWGTYYGGKLEDTGWSLLTDNNGDIYIAGETKSKEGIATPGSYQSFHGGEVYDGFLAKLSDKETSVFDVSNNLRNEIFIFPNPATEYITINLERCATLQKCGTSTVEIYNVMGLKIQTTPVVKKNFSSLKQRIDVSNLSPGVYFVKIVGSNGAWSIVDKFVKY